MKISLSNLNWNNANVLEFKYIYYLALMVDERMNGIGLNTSVTSYSYDLKFCLNNYEPCGFFRFRQLYDIYTAVIYLGRYVYFNPDTLNNQSFKNGKRILHFGYSIKDLCEIGNFDFYRNPLVPNQPLNFYNKFLKPLYLILKEYKKIWINSFYGNDDLNLNYGYNNQSEAKTVKYGIEQPLVGQDYMDYFTLANAKTHEIIYNTTGSTLHEFTLLGGLMGCDYGYIYSFGYLKDIIVEGRTVRVHEHDYAQNYDGKLFKWYLTIPETTICCPVPLLKGCPYQLYMYSCHYPLKTFRDQLKDKANLPNWYWIQSYGPYFVMQPFGNYFLVENGVTSYTFNTFDISVPDEFPYDESVFNQFPLKELSNPSNYNNVDYEPYSYDQTLWTRSGSTPERSDDRQRELTPGSYLTYIGPSSEFNNGYGCIIEWWYRPLLIISYESIFKYN